MTAPAGAELAPFLAAAERIARAGGDVLVAWLQRMRDVPTEFKGRRELVTEADRQAERVVVGALLDEFPDHAVLAEEGVLTPRGAPHRGGEWSWIVDPLDGTTNYVHQLPFFCVAVALAWRGLPIVGVVHAPVLQWTFTAAHGLGAFRNGTPIRVSPTAALGDALLSTGFSYDRNEPGHDDNAGRVARMLPLCRDLRRFGSAELDLCLTASGQFDGYWEMYLQPYDVAAGAVVVREAGGRVTDLRGGDGWTDGSSVLASNGKLHAALLDVIGS